MQAVMQPAQPAQPAPAVATTPAARGSVTVKVNANPGAVAANIRNKIDDGINHAIDKSKTAAGNAVNPAGHSLFSEYTWARWVFGIVYLVIGVPLCFLGLAWWKWNCFPFSGLIGFTVGLTVIDLFAGGTVSSAWMWGGLGLAVALAAALVVVFFFCKRMTGGLLGFALGWVTFTWLSMNYRLMTGGVPGWWGIIILACLAAGGIVLGCLWSKNMIMLTTAVAGGWYAVAGVGSMTGHFPNPVAGTAAWITWCYVITAACLCVGGYFFQCIQKRNRDKLEEHAEGAEGITEGVTGEVHVRIDY